MLVPPSSAGVITVCFLIVPVFFEGRGELYFGHAILPFLCSTNISHIDPTLMLH